MATSGTFTGARGGSGTGPYLSLSWSRIDIDEVNNKSQIRLTLNLVSDYSLSFSASKTGVLEGTSFTYTGGFSGTGTKTIKTLDIWVTHNSDGSLTTTFDGTFNIAISWGGSTVSSLSVSGSATIDTIPRASDFTAFTLSNTVLNKDTANTINYTLGRKSTAFTQDMTLQLGSIVIKSWNTAGTGALTQSLTAAEVNTILTKLPNATSGQLTLVMQTKSGSTNIGLYKTIGEDFTLNSAIVPTASALAVSIYGTGRDKTINKYVQGISKVTASFTSVAGYGATVSSNTIVVKRQSDNGNSQTITSSNGTIANAVSLSGVYVITATITDSRGRSASVSTTITVDAYSAPTITTFATVRDAATTTNVKATVNVAWSGLGTLNPTDITIVGVNNVGTSVNLYTLNDSTAGALNTTQTYASQSDASSYAYTITVTDSFGKEAKAVSTLGTSFVEFTIAKGKGIGVGKVWEKGALDVNGDVYVSGKIDNINVLAETGGGGDLNNLGGQFRAMRTGNVTTNRPRDYMSVLNIPISVTSDFQIASYYGGQNLFYMRGRKDIGGIWQPWEQLTTHSAGGNGNGDYIRFTDGTQICYVRLEVLDQGISSAYGSLFQGTRVWTYPAAFIEKPNAICSEFRYGTGASWGGIGGSISTTSVDLRGWDIATRAAGGSICYISASAIGRWK